MTAQLVGVDIGGTNLRVLATGTPLGPGLAEAADSQALSIPVPRDYPSLVDTIHRLAETAMADRSAEITSIGIGLPGASAGGRATFVPALHFLDGMPLAADLRNLTGAPVFLANDAHCALLAEHRWGRAQGRSDVALVVVGTGLGGAMLVNGSPYLGAHGTAGAFGWLPTDAAWDQRHGQYEIAASGLALSNASAAIGLGPAEVVSRARAGETASLRVLEAYAGTLGRGLAAIASIADPELIVVGGVITDAWDLLRPEVSDAMARWASPVARDTPIEPAELGARAGVLGAVALADASVRSAR